MGDSISFDECLALLKRNPKGFSQAVASKPSLLGERWYGGETLLHFLTVERDYENVRFLESLGADINAMNPDGGTPLHSAILGNDRMGVSVLLELGADPSLRNGSGCDALEWAEFVDADVYIRDLLRKGAE